MNIAYLNALRLGFSTRDAEKIQAHGVAQYISNQLDTPNTLNEPEFLKDIPKSLKEYTKQRQLAKEEGADTKKIIESLNKSKIEWKSFLLQRCFETQLPIRENINLFFQNHFVVTLQSVYVTYWICQHYKTINDFSLGNYKDLVTEMVYSNAVLKYLDNQRNKKGRINENLARELLELFTLGEGNYTENDIKNTARALAGLDFGEEKGAYKPLAADHDVKTVFGKSGNFNIDDVIDIIFEQKNTPYFLAEKALKWFFYDQPPAALITFYGDLLKNKNYELKPFFKEMFAQECLNTQGGNQIKSPLVYFTQVLHDLQITPNYKVLSFLLKNQSMNMYDQPNVKGWKGGKEWLSSQIYADRNQFIDQIIDKNKGFEEMMRKGLEESENSQSNNFTPKLTLTNTQNATAIIEELTEKMIFEKDDDMQLALSQILKYDFNPNVENATKSILKVYQYLAKSPEFQII